MPNETDLLPITKRQTWKEVSSSKRYYQSQPGWNWRSHTQEVHSYHHQPRLTLRTRRLWLVYLRSTYYQCKANRKLSLSVRRSIVTTVPLGAGYHTASRRQHTPHTRPKRPKVRPTRTAFSFDNSGWKGRSRPPTQ